MSMWHECSFFACDRLRFVISIVHLVSFLDCVDQKFKVGRCADLTDGSTIAYAQRAEKFSFSAVKEKYSCDYSFI